MRADIKRRLDAIEHSPLVDSRARRQRAIYRLRALAGATPQPTEDELNTWLARANVPTGSSLAEVARSAPRRTAEDSRMFGWLFLLLYRELDRIDAGRAV